jgi:hypothetical protein
VAVSFISGGNQKTVKQYRSYFSYKTYVTSPSNEHISLICDQIVQFCSEIIIILVFNATFNNISVIKWPSVLLVEETRIHWENHRQAWSHWQAYHIMLYRVHLACMGFELATLVMMGTDYIGSYESNYHMITTTTTPIHGICQCWNVNDVDTMSDLLFFTFFQRCVPAGVQNTIMNMIRISKVTKSY